MNIPFFNRFKKWKTFKIWKKRIQGDKVKLCNKVMNSNLFILNKHLRGPLFQIRKLCCSITEWKLFIIKESSKKSQPLTLKQFLANQTKHRMVLKNKLFQMCNKIKIELLNACENRLHHHLIENGFREKKSTRQNCKKDVNVSHAERAAIRTE